MVSNNEIKEADEEFTPDTYDDQYLNMELAVPRGDNPNPQYTKVTKRLRDTDGIPIGMANENPILDCHMYEVEYQDGTKASLVANYIAENLFVQVDQEGNRHILLDELIDYRVNGCEVKLQDAFITTGTGTRRRHETTIGWELLAQWKDGSTNWISLKDLKESYPVQTAEYAVAAKIAMEPAFTWWVPYTLKKRNQIISKVKSKYWLRTHKFGIRIPKSVEEAKCLDQENGDTLWWEAICNEMRNIRPAFEVWEKVIERIPPGYQQIKCHENSTLISGITEAVVAPHVSGNQNLQTGVLREEELFPTMEETVPEIHSPSGNIDVVTEQVKHRNEFVDEEKGYKGIFMKHVSTASINDTTRTTRQELNQIVDTCNQDQV